MNTATKYTLLVSIALAAIIAAVLSPSIPQDTTYHQFADTRALAGIPNSGDVLSNLGFLVVGAWGLWTGRGRRFAGAFPGFHHVYFIFFVGVFFTAFGSAFYHWSPSNAALVWDRLPMTIAFMAFFTAVIGEQVSPPLALKLLAPLVALGIFSVAYWHFTEQKGIGDLRIYALVQFLPIILIPLMLLLFPSPFTSTKPYWLAIMFYALAKVFEFYDAVIFAWGLGVSGHSIKHLMAACGAAAVLWGLSCRVMRGELARESFDPDVASRR